MPWDPLISSIQRLLCLPLLLVHSLGVHSVTLWVHLLSCRLARWPAHLHFLVLISCMMSLTFVFSLRSIFLTLSLFVTPTIIRSIALSVTRSFFSSFLVVVHVSAPYESTGIIHWLNICFFKEIGRSLSRKMRVSLPNFAHANCILLFTSASKI